MRFKKTGGPQSLRILPCPTYAVTSYRPQWTHWKLSASSWWRDANLVPGQDAHFNGRF